MTTPYEGQPDNAPTAITPVDDSLAPNATNFNTPLQGGFDLACNARATIAGSVCGNWPKPAAEAVVSAVSYVNYAWDPASQQWLCGAQTAGGATLSRSADAGETWNAMSPALSGGAVIAMTSTGQYGDVLLLGSSTPTIIDRYDFQGNHTFSNSVGFPSALTGGVGDYFSDVVPANPGANPQRHFFAWVQTGGTFVGHWRSQSDGAAVGAWAGNDSSLPAAFASGTNHVGAMIAVNTTKGRRAAVAGDIELVAICGVTPGTDTPRLMSVTSNGAVLAATISDITAQLPVPGVGYVIAGLDYDEVNLLWGIALATSVAGTYVYSSPDLVTWTQVHQFPFYGPSQLPSGLNGPGRCLACVGGTWALWLGANTDVAAAWFTPRILYSWNVAQKGAASIWKAGNLSLSPTGGTAAGPGAVLLTNGSQLLAGQNSNGSHAYSKISLDAGIYLAGGSGLY